MSGTGRRMAEAVALQRAGRLREAVAAYRAVIAADPLVAEAHNNLAAALGMLGDVTGAVASYRRAVALRPGYAFARANLGDLLVRLGREREGFEELAAAYLAAPEEAALRDRLVAAATARAPAPGPALGAALDRLAADPAIDLQSLAAPLTGLLRAAPGMAEESGPRRFVPALRRLLADTIVADEDIERRLTALRRRWLDAPPADLSVAAGVALQAQASERVWDEMPGEGARAAVLAADATRADDPRLVLRALWRPLGDLACASAIGAAVPHLPAGPVRTLLARELVEPAEEAALAASLPALTAIDDATSRAVRAQYEANPYPRWRTLPRRPARPISEVLARVLPAAPPVRARPRVLVAGCGTGRHACLTATRYAGAEVLAVDLSRTSLGYAARQARAFGIGNVRFAVADLLGLGALGERFDLVECSGTLHHMAEPERGWAVLRGLVRPGGLMRIGLYSARGRAGVAEARAEIARLRLRPDAAGIRAARRALRRDGVAPRFAPFRESPDFFSMSGCRDLLFHAHEDPFDLSRIARALDRLDLEFLGFELPSPSVLAAFRRRHPRPGAARDLAAWDAFEAAEPTAFAAMYQFWCRAA